MIKVTDERKGLLWTERKFACGCVAYGPGNIPAYCGVHELEPVLSSSYDNTRCDYCGATIMFKTCNTCGAPQCCPQCCRIDHLERVIKPFADCLGGSSGRLPIEKLSLANWHDLSKAYDQRISNLENYRK